MSNGGVVVVGSRQRRIFSRVEIHQSADPIRVAGAERVQDVAAARVADEDRPPHLELVDDFEDIVGATLRAVARRRVIGRADAAPGDGVDVEPIGQLRRDGVVDVGRQVAADEDQRPPRPAPVEDFEADG